ncbi:hypothetical protein ACQP00_15555 [Dactylosporangium sp. CS-047395]|uniref:hypothetical protein n=1 Tax=Dactylosporangium sp. CS-047395 TaxID=3239936 RepID=UPI003D933AA0
MVVLIQVSCHRFGEPGAQRVVGHRPARAVRAVPFGREQRRVRVVDPVVGLPSWTADPPVQQRPRSIDHREQALPLAAAPAAFAPQQNLA